MQAALNCTCLPTRPGEPIGLPVSVCRLFLNKDCLAQTQEPSHTYNVKPDKFCAQYAAALGRNKGGVIGRSAGVPQSFRPPGTCLTPHSPGGMS